MTALAEGSRRRRLAGIDAFYAHVETMHGADVLDRFLITPLRSRHSCCASRIWLLSSNVVWVVVGMRRAGSR
jgi:hypothetical protein